MNYYILALKKYADFTGRSTRAEYWYFILFNLIFSIVLAIVAGILGDDRNILGNIYSLALIVPSLAVAVRRLHDIGKSGWMVLVSFIPIAGAIWIIVLLATDSTPGDNMYGPNPKGVMATTPTAPPTTPAV